MSRIRHWKQRWDPNAPLKFAKRLRIGDDPNKPYVYPGELVTDEHRRTLGLNRLRRWWDAHVIERADFDPTVRGGIVKDWTPAHKARPLGAVHVQRKGAGWFTVSHPNGEEKIRGEKKALQRAAELRVALRVNGERLREGLQNELAR